jgi:hypothetical protein
VSDNVCFIASHRRIIVIINSRTFAYYKSNKQAKIGAMSTGVTALPSIPYEAHKASVLPE